jgi:CheY-like chemotaxis protein
VLALAPGQPVYRVLVVDDIEQNRTLLQDLLGAVGFDVRTAPGGDEAIAAWRDWQPHLVWMDKRMPRVDGLEATRRIRAEEQRTGGAHVPILALSASALEHERAEILAAGCDDFVPKPFREGAIFEKMAEYLGMRYAYDETPGPPAAATPVTGTRLAGVSAEWRLGMQEALALGDMDAAAALARQIGGKDAALARDLLALLGAFRLDELQGALASVLEEDPR